MFPLELFAAERSQPVMLDTPVVLGDLPLRRHPAFQFQPLQRRVQGTELDVERLTRIAANRLRDSVAMQRRDEQRSENEHLEGSLKEIHIEAVYIKSVIIAI